MFFVRITEPNQHAKTLDITVVAPTNEDAWGIYWIAFDRAKQRNQKVSVTITDERGTARDPRTGVALNALKPSEERTLFFRGQSEITPEEFYRGYT